VVAILIPPGKIRRFGISEKAKLTQSIPPENYRYNETRYTLQQSHPEAARKLLKRPSMTRWPAGWLVADYYLLVAASKEC